MKPSEIYNAIRAYKNCESDMCSLKATCVNFGGCTSKSSTKVIDFDEVKNEYCSVNSINPLWKSVDGVCATRSDSLFLFIEKKSWTKFFKYQEHSEKRIVEQANDFCLNEKYSKSVEICRNVVGQQKIFTEDNHAFLFYSDINPNISPLIAFQYNLNMLANTSTAIQMFAVNASKRKIESVTCKKRFFVFCNDYDNYINLK